jgi:pilus assembly protein CpaB
VDWPKQAVPPGAFTSVEALLGERRDQRRTVLQSIERGEPILDAKIMRLGQSLALAVSPAEGMRAVSVRIDGASSELQKLSAGDRVDVFLVRLLKEQPVESLILQDIRILAIAEPQTADAELASTDRQVAFELDEGVQEQKLLLAQQVGQLVIKER